MGLLGFFFSKRFLKLVFIIASAFVFLQLSTLFISRVSGLSLFPQVVLITLTLLVSTFLTMRCERFNVLSGVMRFLCFTVVPLILVLNFVLPASIPFPLSAPIKLGALALPFIAYIAYRKKRWIWRRSSSLIGESRCYGKLSKDALLPNALEDGHVVYGAGIKGFKVLKFMEIEDPQLDSIDEHVTAETHLQLVAREVSAQLPMMKKYGVEMSYELYLRNGTLQGFIGFMCEDRNYGKARTTIDDLSRALTRDSTLRGATTDPTTRSVEDSMRAEHILAMPLFITFEDLKRIENDDYNVKVFGYSFLERPTRLRSIHVSGLPSASQGQEISVVSGVVQAALAHTSPRNIACIVHIRPLPDCAIDQELVRAGNAYQQAMTCFIDVMKNGFLGGKTRGKTPFLNRRNAALDPRSILEESKTRFQRLKEAKEAGYFEISLTIVGEPAVAESIARLFKNKLSEKNPSAVLSIVRAPPAAIRGIVRRDIMLPLGRLSGSEVQFLIAPADKSHEPVTDNSERMSMKSPAQPFAEKAALSR